MGREYSESRADGNAFLLGTVVAVALLSCLSYLIASHLTYRLGFPLDDSWIHAAFAHNLAAHGEWALRLGGFAGGSTSPLWTVLLVPGYMLGLGPLWWCYLLGAVELAALACLGELVARWLAPSYSSRLPWVGLFLAVEWHLVWAAVSGMETLLHALVVTSCLVLLLRDSHKFLALGMLVGLSAWIRPDGLTLILPTLVVVFLRETSVRGKVVSASWHLFGVAALALPYLVFNLWISGHPMPTTFYAKQAEYAAWQARPAIERLYYAVVQLLTGPLLLLLPGIVWFARKAIVRRSVASCAALAWAALYIVMYAWRLPPYQHGRYLMPAMPIVFIMAAIGYVRLREDAVKQTFWDRTTRVWSVGIAVFSVAFLVLGARAYGRDVGLIESEMVNTAKWVKANLPRGSVVAAHDIGALGYFDDHPLLDLAGLVSPQVIPFMRDEVALADYLDRHGARYLVSFPGLYPALEKASTVVYRSGGRFAPSMGQGNMTVYCWACP